MIYKFRVARRARPKLEKPVKDEKPAEEAVGLIQGQVPDSKQEVWIAKALNRLELSYQYQYPVYGGRSAGRGGYMIDFLVFTQPLATMIEPIGNHWHTGELGADDRKRQADIEAAMMDIAKTPMLLLWIPDLESEETVYQRLRQELLS